MNRELKNVKVGMNVFITIGNEIKVVYLEANINYIDEEMFESSLESFKTHIGHQLAGGVRQAHIATQMGGAK